MSKVETHYVGDGKVYLIAGGNKIYTDIAARFVRSERPVKEIIESPYSPQIVHNIIESGHGAALEFDYFIFGVEGYSRVCETQLVRKRIASYLIKSGRQELNGKRHYSVVIPEEIKEASVDYIIPEKYLTIENAYLPIGNGIDRIGEYVIPINLSKGRVHIYLSPESINNMIEYWYSHCLETGRYKEENLRYMKPQGTEFKAIIGMNMHSLRDWWAIRMCRNAQEEIRDLATKMFKLVKSVAPDLVEGAGASCTVLGYCPEGRLQNEKCKGKIPLKEDVLNCWKQHGNIKGVNTDVY